MKKKTLLMSLLTLALCVSLIAGGTFALFTHESKTNIAITSGKVEVVATIEKSTAQDWIYSPTSIAMNGSIVDATNAANLVDGIFANKGSATVNGANVSLSNVTPGDEVNLFVDIKNNSNVAIQYRYTVEIEGNIIDGIEISIKNELYTKNYASTWLPADPGADIQDVPVSIKLPTTAKSQGGDFKVWIKVEAVQGNADTTEDNNDEPVVAVGTAADLLSMLTSFGEGDGNSTVVITNDIQITPEDNWVPAKIDGYGGTGVVTIEGNGKTIYGLTDTLFAGGFAGNSGIVINNLTIENANITSSNDQGYGAFINCVDSMPKIILSNCHLVNSVITDTLGARVGGLIGWSAGYNDVNNGPVDTYITVENCSVTGCKITASGSVGAIIGHAGNNAATYHTIQNCTITNNVLHSTDNGGWRVGVVVGTANVGEVTISNITESGNTLTQIGKTAPEGQSNLYGRFVPGTTGKLTIDTVTIA